MKDSRLSYMDSAEYVYDLGNVQKVWAKPLVFGVSGIFIFLSYLTVPMLTAVHPTDNPDRSQTFKGGIIRGQEKRFLERLLGLTGDRAWSGGICNPKVMMMIEALRKKHMEYKGMELAYMRFFAGIIALSALRSAKALDYIITLQEQASYWRYMNMASELLGSPLQGITHTGQTCEAFLRNHSQATENGKRILLALQDIYPEYLVMAEKVVFPTTGHCVKQMLGVHNVNFVA